ncbi:MAG: molybdopterin-dependent oxidoreductase [Chloroflexi bacterium]|nr:molybdopterin-dependent oxidoreductase [Chloroflexota bacterium]
MDGKTIVRTQCKSCHGSCSVLVTVENGVITYMEGNPDAPTKGAMCAKGLSQIQSLNHPDRLVYPRKRAGARGEGKWERISWEEALETLTVRMKEYIAKGGANSVCVGQGTGRGYNHYTTRLVNSIGTGHLLSPGYICFVPLLQMSRFMFGVSQKLYCDFHGWGGEWPRTIVSWGRQTETNNADGEMAVWFLEALKHSKNFILIDPRATALAHRANLWLPVRPGTDAALALAMLNIIINEGIYDKEFVSNWTLGFDKLAARVQDYPPEKAAEITWVPKEKIVRAARMIALESPAAIQIGEPLVATRNTTSNLQAILSLIAITGNVERPGGMVDWVPSIRGGLEEFGFEVMPPKENLRNAIGSDKHRLPSGRCHPDTVLKQLREGTSIIKMLYQHGGNPLFSMANSRHVYEAMLKIEYMVVAEQYMSPLAEIADMVLPVCHWLEDDDIWDVHARFYNAAVNRAVSPRGEARSSSWIINEIGRRVVPQHWFNNVEEMLDYQLKGANIKWKEFKEIGIIAKTGKDQQYYKYKTDYYNKGGGFATPTKKVELYSPLLAKLGYDPLPSYVEPSETPYSNPELAREYPYILNTGGRIPFYFHSQYTNLPWVRQFQPLPRVQIHPETAGKHGIAEGDWVWIESPRGRIKQVANLFAGMDPRLVVVQSSWSYPEKPGPEHGFLESNANVLTADEGDYDPAAGSINMRSLLCKIYKVEKTNDNA